MPSFPAPHSEGPPRVDGDSIRQSPMLRLNMEPPSDDLGEVLSEVEHLSEGIDTMLHHACNSAVGGREPIGSDDDDDTDFEGDDPMIAMFDEHDDASDIHTIDRMLAEEARQLMPAHVPVTSEPAFTLALASDRSPDDIDDRAHYATEAEAKEEPEVALEGDYESFESLIASEDAHESNSAIEHGASPAKPIATDLVPTPESPVIQTKTDDGRIVVDIQQTQAAGLATAITEAAEHEFEANAPTDASSDVGLHQPAETQTRENADFTARESSNETSTEFSGAAPTALTQSASGASLLVRILATLNLPLRLVPAGLRPAVNAFAISLVLWAPAVWAIAPRMAASDLASAVASHDSPEHAESTITSDNGHGSSGHSASAPKAEKKSAAKKKSTAKSTSKSKTKAESAAHSSGGH